jgi:hypothetical protein
MHIRPASSAEQVSAAGSVRGLYHRYGITPIPKDYINGKKSDQLIQPPLFYVGLPHSGSPIIRIYKIDL